MITVSGLHIHPVKSCASVALERMRLDAWGPCDDRRLMIVSASGKFITQRTTPRLALVDVERDAERLRLRAPAAPPIEIVLDPAGERIATTVWSHHGDAIRVSREADAWLSQWLGETVMLVGCPPKMDRIANRDWVDHDAPVGFADAYPILLTTEGSLDALNGRLERAIPMSRFRPNLVLKGCEPFAEDDWRRIRVGSVTLDMVKPCDRCVVTTIDPATAQKQREPLATLARFRRSKAGVLFGQNCVARGTGEIALGEPVEILETGSLARLPDDFRLLPERP